MTWLSNLTTGGNVDILMALLSGASTFLVIYAVWSSFLVRNPITGRAKALMKQRARMQSELRTPKRHQLRAMLANGGLVRRIVERLNLLKSNHAERVQLSMARAGWRGREQIILYLFAKTFLPIAVGVVVSFAIFGLGLFNVTLEIGALIALGSTLIAAYFPDLIIRNAQTRRKQALTKGLPDALDLLVICAEAGLSLDAALKRVGHEMARATPEMSDEFLVTALELSYLPDRSQALGNLSQRTDLAPIRGVVNTLAQTEKYGTPLAQSLRVLAAEFRNERMMRAEEKAAKLPATLTVPLILFILPSLFVVLLGPAVISTIDNLLTL